MEKKFVLIEFKEERAVLEDEDEKEKVLWPKNSLPKDLKIGDKVNFLISEYNADISKRNQAAQDVLNEILSLD